VRSPGRCSNRCPDRRYQRWCAIVTWRSTPPRFIALGFFAVAAFDGVDDVALVFLATDTFDAGDSVVGLLLGSVGIGLLIKYVLLTHYGTRATSVSDCTRNRFPDDIWLVNQPD
jgi:hypothetical protein